MQQLDLYYQHFSQHVSGIIMTIFRRPRRVLLHVVCCAGSAGCEDGHNDARNMLRKCS